MSTETLDSTELQEVKVGDIFYTSWGYDQTNVNYYLVIEVSKTGKTVKLREVGGMETPDSERNGCAAYTETIPTSIELAPNFVIEHHQRFCVHCRRPIEISRYGSTEGRLIHRRSNTVECLDDEGRPTPGTKAKRGKPTIYTKRVRYCGGWGRRNDAGKLEPVLAWTSYANAYLWDGRPKYQTASGFGH